MKQYLDLVQYVLDHGTRKENRTGVDTLSAFNYNYQIDLAKGFPLLTTKEVNWKNIVIELLWFLSGSRSPEFLERHKCGFWRSWYIRNDEVSNCYGPAWRQFGQNNDQIKWVLEELKRNPMSRRLVVSAWEPEIAQKAILPPCHCMFMFNVQNIVETQYRCYGCETNFSEDTYRCKKCHVGILLDEKIEKQKLCLHLTQRSGDVALGIPYNVASYSLLLSLFSRFSGIESGIFAHTIVDAHIYTSKANGDMKEYDHIPGALEQLKRTPRSLPKLIIDPAIKNLSDVEELLNPKLTTEEIMKHFILEGYDPHPKINFKVAV